MTTPLLVVLVVSTVVLLLSIVALLSARRGRAIAALRNRPVYEPVWLGRIKRGARRWRASRFTYFRPGPQVPSYLTRNVVNPLRDLADAWRYAFDRNWWVKSVNG